MRHRTWNRRVVVRTATALAVATAIVIGCSRPAPAQDQEDTLEKAVGRLAGDIATYLKAPDRPQDTILIEEFRGPPRTSAGLGIKSMLKTQLEQQGFRTTGVGMQVRGHYLVASRDGFDVMLITVELFDATGARVKEFVDRFQEKANPDGTGIQEEVGNQADIAAAVGATVPLTAAAASQPGPAAVVTPATTVNPAETVKPADAPVGPITQSVLNPEFTALQSAVAPVKSVVAPGAQSPFRLEILARDLQTGQYVPLPVANRDGHAFVSIATGQEYAVRIINTAGHDVGVRLTIDGLNAFTFTEIPPYRALGMFYIAQGRPGTIKGWHINNGESHSFLVTDLPGSAAAKLGRETGEIGVITAIFFHAANSEQQFKLLNPLGKGRGAQAAGTGTGARIGAPYAHRQAIFGRDALASVSVRYDIEPLPPSETQP